MGVKLGVANEKKKCGIGSFVRLGVCNKLFDKSSKSFYFKATCIKRNCQLDDQHLQRRCDKAQKYT